MRCPSDPGVGLPALGRTNYTVSIGDAYRGAEFQGPHNNDLFRVETQRSIESTQTQRGFFRSQIKTSFRDCLDGLSNTIAMAEIATDLGDRDIRTRFYNRGLSPAQFSSSPPTFCRQDIDPLRPRFWAPTVTNLLSVTQGRGFHWASYYPIFGMTHTVLPPNAEICGRATMFVGQLMTASSRHQGGVHVCMGDGAVKFITDSIDTGNLAMPTVHNTGVGPRAPGSPSPYGLWGALGTRASKETISVDF